MFYIYLFIYLLIEGLIESSFIAARDASSFIDGSALYKNLGGNG